jgi:hypothetical protein
MQRINAFELDRKEVRIDARGYADSRIVQAPAFKRGKKCFASSGHTLSFIWEI